MLWIIINLVPSAHIFLVYWCQQAFLGSVISYNLDSCLANIAFPVWFSSWVFVMTVPLEGGLYSMWWIAWCDRDNAFRLWSCATLIDLQSVVIRLAMTSDSLLASQVCPICAALKKTQCSPTIWAYSSGYICDVSHTMETNFCKWIL